MRKIHLTKREKKWMKEVIEKKRKKKDWKCQIIVYDISKIEEVTIIKLSMGFMTDCCQHTCIILNSLNGYIDLCLLNIILFIFSFTK